MTSAEFEKLYEEVRPSAVSLARQICGSAAEDVVQDVAVYFFERLDSLPRMTPSFFRQMVSNRARNRMNPRAGRNKYEEEVGDRVDLSRLEMMQMPETGRRNSTAPRAE